MYLCLPIHHFILKAKGGIFSILVQKCQVAAGDDHCFSGNKESELQEFKCVEWIS